MTIQLYNVHRLFMKSGRKRLILKNVTLEIAQLHCRSKETSYKTCTTSKGKRRTRERGPWFDSYDKA